MSSLEPYLFRVLGEITPPSCCKKGENLIPAMQADMAGMTPLMGRAEGKTVSLLAGKCTVNWFTQYFWDTIDADGETVFPYHEFDYACSNHTATDFTRRIMSMIQREPFVYQALPDIVPEDWLDCFVRTWLIGKNALDQEGWIDIVQIYCVVCRHKDFAMMGPRIPWCLREVRVQQHNGKISFKREVLQFADL